MKCSWILVDQGNRSTGRSAAESEATLAHPVRKQHAIVLSSNVPSQKVAGSYYKWMWLC